MSQVGRFEKRDSNHSKKSGTLAKVLIALAVLLILGVGAFLGISVYRGTMEQMADTRPTVPPLATEQDTEPVDISEPTETEPVVTTEETLPYTPSGKDIINVLVVGQNYHSGEQNYLADTMILATVNKATNTLTLTSFLRDSLVTLVDHTGKIVGSNRINTTYALGYSWAGQAGAMDMANNTLKENFGVDVDYNVEVSFEGVMGCVDILGKIPVELNDDEAAYITSEIQGWDNFDNWYPEGIKSVYDDGSTVTYLEGYGALSYARMRKSNAADNDFNRSARQRYLISAIIDMVKDSDLNTLMNLAKSLLSQITTNMTDDEILTCMWEVLPLLKDLKIESYQIPLDGTWWAHKQVPNVPGYPTQFYPKENKDFVMAYAEADVLSAQATEPAS